MRALAPAIAIVGLLVTHARAEDEEPTVSYRPVLVASAVGGIALSVAALSYGEDLRGDGGLVLGLGGLAVGVAFSGSLVHLAYGQGPGPVLGSMGLRLGGGLAGYAFGTIVPCSNEEHHGLSCQTRNQIIGLGVGVLAGIAIDVGVFGERRIPWPKRITPVITGETIGIAGTF